MATGAVKKKPRERQKEKTAVALLHNGPAAQLPPRDPVPQSL